MPAFYDYAPVVINDDIPAKTIGLERVISGVVQSLAGAKVTMEILRGGKRVYKTVDNDQNGGITIVDEPNAIVRIEAIPTEELTAARYQYVIHVEWADGFDQTMVAGDLIITNKDPKNFATV